MEERLKNYLSTALVLQEPGNLRAPCLQKTISKRPKREKVFVHVDEQEIEKDKGRRMEKEKDICFYKGGWSLRCNESEGKNNHLQ